MVEPTCSVETARNEENRFARGCPLHHHRDVGGGGDHKGGGLVITHIDDRLNPTIHQDVKKANRPVLVAEDNMTIRL
jgi:hypothetical protein